MNSEDSKTRPDLTSVHPHYTWEAVNSGAAGGEEGSESAPAADPEVEVVRLRAELKRLTAALEDVVALALTDGDARQRAIVMQRRAIAALTKLDAPSHDSAAAPPPPDRPAPER